MEIVCCKIDGGCWNFSLRRCGRCDRVPKTFGVSCILLPQSSSTSFMFRRDVMLRHELNYICILLRIFEGQFRCLFIYDGELYIRTLPIEHLKLYCVWLVTMTASCFDVQRISIKRPFVRSFLFYFRAPRSLSLHPTAKGPQKNLIRSVCSHGEMTSPFSLCFPWKRFRELYKIVKSELRSKDFLSIVGSH